MHLRNFTKRRELGDSDIRMHHQGSITRGKGEATKGRNQALHYKVYEGVLCMRTYLGSLLRCFTPEEANYPIREIHMGICRIHAGPREVIAKIMNAGSYWPKMHMDAVEN
jgi:hypothetical protein